MCFCVESFVMWGLSPYMGAGHLLKTKMMADKVTTNCKTTFFTPTTELSHNKHVVQVDVSPVLMIRQKVRPIVKYLSSQKVVIVKGL